jgi:hypothetical protein
MTTIANRIQIKKLDSRYNGYPRFRFFVDIAKSTTFTYNTRFQRYSDHLLLRQWCHEQWGHSCEWDLYTYALHHDIHNLHWCWDAKEHKSRILVAGQEEVSLMCLSFDVA